MISLTEAQKILTANARSFGKEAIGLDRADGRTLAETILADRDYPPFNRSSMDGYAIRYSDFEKGARHFSVTGTIYAGQSAATSLGPDQCYKIMTGAPVPLGADTVIRKEDADETAGVVKVRLTSCRLFQNIARQGEDMRYGDIAVGCACRCEPALIGLLASLGKDRLLVERLPLVALLTTGDEVVPVDIPAGPFQIRNSNRWLLQSFLKKWGIIPSYYEHIPDDRPVLQDSLSKLLGSATLPASFARSLPGSASLLPGSAPASISEDPGPASPLDIIILSGGVSAGDADYVPGVLEELGVQKLFHKVAIKPGKPVWCGLASAPGHPAAPATPHTMVFALPGNPFSCLVNFVLLIQPYLHACFGLPAPAARWQPLQGSRKKNTPLDEFFPVCSGRSDNVPGSSAALAPVHINGSGDIRLGMQADALALHPAGGGDLADGTMICCYNL